MKKGNRHYGKWYKELWFWIQERTIRDVAIRDILWALWFEPKRLWAWKHRHNPMCNGRKFTFLQAVKAVVNNPPCLDASWDEDMEK